MNSVWTSPRWVTVPKFDLLARTCPDNNMNALAALKENQYFYCLPLTSSNFETFDLM